VFNDPRIAFSPGEQETSRRSSNGCSKQAVDLAVERVFLRRGAENAQWLHNRGKFAVPEEGSHAPPWHNTRVDRWPQASRIAGVGGFLRRGAENAQWLHNRGKFAVPEEVSHARAWHNTSVDR